MLEEKEKRAPNALNVYRVIAALCVFLLHATIFDAFDQREGVSPFLFFLFPSAWGGVFMFMTLGGFLAGKGFSSGRYEMSVKGVLDYYKKRVVRILLPAWAYLFLVILLVYPTMFTVEIEKLLPIVFLYFNGAESVNGIGHTWYVFTALHLYLLTPFFHFFFAKCKKRGNGSLWGLMIGIIAAGLVFRLCMALYISSLPGTEHGSVWYNDIYTPFWGNLDLWLSGMILSEIDRSKVRRSRSVRILAGIALAVLLLVSAWFSYTNNGGYSWYLSPTLYAVVSLFFFDTFDREGGAKGNTPIDSFAGYTFEFYLFHSLVFMCVCKMFASYELPVWGLHLILIFLGFAITLLLSVAFHRIFERKQKQINPSKG